MTRQPSQVASPCAALATLAVLVLMASPANAGVSADECVDANDTAQSLRRDGKFADARAQLTMCADASCPRLVRSDCVQRLDELSRVQPSVVFDVKDAGGNDMVAVRVSADGRPLADKIAGTALQADPGEHVFTFEVAGLPPVTRTFVLKEGEKARRERIVLVPVAPALATTPRPPNAAVPSGGPSAQRVVGLVLGGAGIAGTAAGGVFGLLASSANSTQKGDCSSATMCPNHMQALSVHSTVETDGTIPTAAFIAGGALLVTGALLFFTGRTSSHETSSALVVAPSIGPGEGGLSMQGRF